MEKKLLWGGLAGGVTFFILGFLIYGLLMASFLAEQSFPGLEKEMPDFPWLILGNIIMGFFYALVIGSWGNVSSAGEGAKKGFTIGLLLGSGFDLIMFSTTNMMSMTGMLADIVITIVMGTIVGAVVGAVMSPKKAT